jgi:hypothetical protein
MARWSTIQIMAILSVWNLSELSEKVGSDGPSYLGGRSETWRHELLKLWPSYINMGRLSALQGRAVHHLELALFEIKRRTIRNTNAPKHMVPAQTHFGTCGWRAIAATAVVGWAKRRLRSRKKKTNVAFIMLILVNNACSWDPKTLTCHHKHLH